MPADTDPAAEGPSPSESRVETDGDLHSEVVHYDQEEDRRTLFPADAGEDQLLTHWLTADDASFVDLRNIR